MRIMISDYRRRTIRNEARKVIGKYNDKELKEFVKSLSSFINGYSGYEEPPSIEDQLTRPNRPNRK